MTGIPEDDQNEAETLAAHAERDKEAWQRTLSDARALADEREEEGWETLVVPAGDTAPEPPDAGESDRFGLVHVVPGNHADAVREALTAGEFPAYDVYRAETAGRVFLVTELLDEETATALFVVATFERRYADALVRAARDADAMYTHFEKLDGSHLGSVRHDAYEKFFPRADRVAEDPGPAG